MTNSSTTATDRAMKMAKITPCYEVECKECRVLLGYEPNRGAAWEVFFEHCAAVHFELGGEKGE